MDVGTNDGWLGFWGGYLGAIIAIGGIYWQMSQQKKQEIVKARPIFYVGDRRALNKNEKVYYNATGQQWEDEKSFVKNVDLMFIKDLKNGSQFFSTKLRYRPSLLSISNLSKNDAYSCVIKIKYHFGRENDKMFFAEKNASELNQEDYKKELYSEYFVIPIISAKESVIVVIRPVLFEHFANIVSIQMQYLTEEKETGEMDYCVDENRPEDITLEPKYSYGFRKKLVKPYTSYSVVTESIKPEYSPVTYWYQAENDIKLLLSSLPKYQSKNKMIYTDQFVFLKIGLMCKLKKRAIEWNQLLWQESLLFGILS